MANVHVIKKHSCSLKAFVTAVFSSTREKLSVDHFLLISSVKFSLIQK